MKTKNLKTFIVEELAQKNPHALATGPFGSAISSKFFKESGIPVIRGSNLSSDVGIRLIDKDLVYLTTEKASEFQRSVVRRGDLIFTCWGTINQVGLIDKRSKFSEYIISNKQMKFTPDNSQVDSLFLYYLFSSPLMSQKILDCGIGSSVPGFNLGQLKSMQLHIPPLPTQKAIAHILGTLDDKIELNRRMNETLESIARAIFTSWFIDFDPVRAKADGKQPEGMDAATAALFPSEFETVEGQEIPKGWALTPIDQLADFLNGLALQKYPPVGDKCLPVIKIAQIRIDSTENSDSASVEIPPEYVIHDGDLIFSWSGSLEVVIWCGGIGALNQHLFKVTSEKYPRWFIYSWLRYHLPWFQEIAANKATTMGHIQRKHLSEAICYTPDDTVIEQVDSIFSPLFNKIISNKIENKFLTAYRDTLLPKLLSGELPITNPEQFTGVS